MEATEYFAVDDVQEIVDEEWYERNLELAAELGKALLDKNRELESQVNQLQTIIQDQTMEIQFLKYQVDMMRTMTESRNRIYEEVDKTAQDLENNNKKLLMEARADKQKIERQSALICQLEDRIYDLEKNLEDIKTAEKKLSEKVPEKRRTSSLNRLSLIDTQNKKSNYYFENLAWTCSDDFKNIPLNPIEFEIRKLQDSVQHLKTQQTIDRRKNENLEVECSVFMEENQILGNKVKVLEAKLSEAIMVQYELEQSQSNSEHLHKQQSKVSLVGASDTQEEMYKTESKIMREIEHDNPELRSEGKAVKLELGSSLYSSRESINKVANDAKEIQVGDDVSLSILDELELQYQTLFANYQALVQSKGKVKEGEDDSHQHLAHKGVQTLLHITLNRDFYQDTSNMPPYKAIFKDIYAILRKNQREDSSVYPDSCKKDSDGYKRDSDSCKRDLDSYKRDSSSYKRDSDSCMRDSAGCPVKPLVDDQTKELTDDR